MGKRSDFVRRKHDLYRTPRHAFDPLLPHLEPRTVFAEPCAGDGRLVWWLEDAGHVPAYVADIVPRDLFMAHADALTATLPAVDAVITNPPWTRDLMHPLIARWMDQAPVTWLLFDADWKYTKQASSLIRHCELIVAVGRVKWFGNTSGKDNAAWYRFRKTHTNGPHFIGRDHPTR